MSKSYSSPRLEENIQEECMGVPVPLSHTPTDHSGYLTPNFNSIPQTLISQTNRTSMIYTSQFKQSTVFGNIIEDEPDRNDLTTIDGCCVLKGTWFGIFLNNKIWMLEQLLYAVKCLYKLIDTFNSQFRISF